MKIGMFGTGSNPVPPKTYGGVQAVNYMTAERLVEMGHEVFLFAPTGSKTSGKLIRIDSGWGEHIERQNAIKYLTPHVDKIDVLIDTSAFGIPGRDWKKLPYLSRMGGDPNKKYCRYADRNMVFPSKAHLAFHSTGDCSCGKRRLKAKSKTPVIYKPVCYPGRSDDIPFFDGKRDDYYLCIGLIRPHKGTHFAVDFARKAGVRLRVVGPIGDQNYYNKHIKPHLSNKITYEPAVDFNKKWDLFKNAKGTLFTTNCEEGGPNVPLESLLTGTPVIAFNRSTVTECVIDGDTGILCESIEEMVERLPELEKMDPNMCRIDVLNKFSLDNYIERYLDLMKRVIDGERWI